VLRAVEEPIRHIASNSGIDGGVVVDEVGNSEGPIGFNANTGEFVNMFDAGIIDPTKVTRSALENAASIAGLMLTTEAMITNIKEEDEKAPKAEGVVR
jgi:chaperonin GroEL